MEEHMCIYICRELGPELVDRLISRIAGCLIKVS